MTIEQARQTEHISDSLLAEIAKHTTLDIDNNVATVAVQHNLAHRRLLELLQSLPQPGSAVGQQVVSEFQSLFCDMTSNQIIVWFTYTALLENDAAKARELIETCVSAAKQLEQGHWQGEQLDATMRQRLALTGLTGHEEAAERHSQLASDVLTVHFGLEMFPNLLSSGNVHAQTCTSKAYDSNATVKHARRFVALYELISEGAVSSSRVCIKIPTTIPGLQAMRYLSSGGQCDEFNLGGALSEGKIQVLATTVFAVEQGLAAAQAAGAIYVAPYINALAAHFFGVDNPTESQVQIALDAGRRSLDQVIFPLQRCLLRLRREDASICTQVMAASFLDKHEAVQLCGLDHFTLGAPIIEGLATTQLTTEYAEAVEQATAKYYAASDAELDQYGATLAAKEAQLLGCGGWLAKAQAESRLETVLTQDERCRYMLDDALARFTKAEVSLRSLF